MYVFLDLRAHRRYTHTHPAHDPSPHPGLPEAIVLHTCILQEEIYNGIVFCRGFKSYQGLAHRSAVLISFIPRCLIHPNLITTEPTYSLPSRTFWKNIVYYNIYISLVPGSPRRTFDMGLFALLGGNLGCRIFQWSLYCTVYGVCHGQDTLRFKVVFCFRHFTAPHYHHNARLLTGVEHMPMLVGYILWRCV